MSYEILAKAMLIDVWEQMIFRQGDEFVQSIVIDKQGLIELERFVEGDENRECRFTKRLLIYHEAKRRTILGISRFNPDNVTALILYHFTHYPHHLRSDSEDRDTSCNRPDCSEISVFDKIKDKWIKVTLKFSSKRKTCILNQISNGLTLASSSQYVAQDFLDTHLDYGEIDAWTIKTVNYGRVQKFFEKIAKEVQDAFDDLD